jgi:hypothetical protein
MLPIGRWILLIAILVVYGALFTTVLERWSWLGPAAGGITLLLIELLGRAPHIVIKNLPNRISSEVVYSGNDPSGGEIRFWMPGVVVNESPFSSGEVLAFVLTLTLPNGNTMPVPSVTEIVGYRLEPRSRHPDAHLEFRLPFQRGQEPHLIGAHGSIELLVVGQRKPRTYRDISVESPANSRLNYREAASA